MSQQISLSHFPLKSNDTNFSVTFPNKRLISPDIDNNAKRVKLSNKSENTETEN